MREKQTPKLKVSRLEEAKANWELWSAEAKEDKPLEKYLNEVKKDHPDEL